MKLLVILALVATVSGDVCQGHANIDDVHALRNSLLAVAGTIMTDCNPGGDEFISLLRRDSCVTLFNQGKCYYDHALEYYGGEDAVTYGQLQTDIPNLQSLGNTLCAEVADCYVPIKEAVLECAEQDGFIDATIARAQLYYQSSVEARVEKYAADNRDTVFGTLVQIVLSRFTSIADIEEVFAKYTAGTDVESDTTAAVAEIKAAAANFCDVGCTDSTADFLDQIFGALDSASQCVSARTFCGACQARAAHFLRKPSKPDIPCCLRTVVDLAISGSEQVQEKYAQQIQDVEAYLSEQFANKQKLLKKIRKARAHITKQVACLSSVYNDSPHECA